MNRSKLIAAWLAVLALSGCAGMNYDSKIAQVTNGMRSGQLNESIATLESNNTGDDKGLLYYMEKGELLRLKGAFDDSRDTWLKADGKVREWEDMVKTDPSKLLGDLGSVTVNDTTRRYDGRDYEKVLLSIELALDHLSLGNWDNARVEVTKMHERQSIIADFRSKELDQAKADSESKGVKVTSFKELNGYPIETLEAPEVQALKNSYESAFGNYLAGFVYEANGDNSLAAAGYRKAAEMQPNVKMLDDSLAGLDKRMHQVRIPSKKSKSGPPAVDTLLVVETGEAPAIQSQSIGLFLPIPCKNGVCPELVQISWPVIRGGQLAAPGSISVDGNDTPLAMMTSVDAMSRRALYDEMPAIIARSAIRAIAKTAAQKLVDDNADRLSNACAFCGLVASIGAKVAVAVSEVADERAWRTLPAAYSIARLALPEGQHKIALQLGDVSKQVDVAVSGKYSLVALRVVGSQVYVAQPGAYPQAASSPAAASVQASSAAMPAIPAGKL